MGAAGRDGGAAGPGVRATGRVLGAAGLVLEIFGVPGATAFGRDMSGFLEAAAFLRGMPGFLGATGFVRVTLEACRFTSRERPKRRASRA